MELQYNRQQGRDSAAPQDAEGANLGQAKPGETLRQKDPVLDKLWKTLARGTDGVTHLWPRSNVKITDVNLSGPITEARDKFRAPFTFNRQTTSKGANSHERTCQFEIHKIR